MLLAYTLLGVLVLTFLLKCMRQKKYNLPPGPPSLPIIGNVHQIDKTGPHKTFTKWSKEYGDIFKMKIFGHTSIVLNNFESIYEALVTQANQFAGREETYRLNTILRNSPNIIFGKFTPKWIHMKKTAMQVLKMYGENLENLEVITLDLIEEMLAELTERCAEGPVDLYPLFTKCTTGIISSVLFGKKLDEKATRKVLEINIRVGVLLQPTGWNCVLDLMPWLRYFPIGSKLNNDILELAKFTMDILNQHIKETKVESVPNQPRCYVDGLYDHKRKGEENQDELKLTEPEIYGMTQDLLFAGTFTTSTTLNALFAVLVNKPKIQKRMVAEIDRELGSRGPRLADRKSLHYVEAAILEVLRYSSILPLNLPHHTTADVTIGGYEIPKDTEVFCNLWKLHHSPEYWDEPWEFKPERYLDENNMVVPPDHMNRKRLLAFGASRRVCIGETLAKNRLFLMVTSLLQHFEFLPAGPDEIPRHDPREYKSTFGIEPCSYRVVLVPRH